MTRRMDDDDPKYTPQDIWAHVDAMRALYAETGNPMFAWEAITSCARVRQDDGSISIPGWCAPYLEDCANNVYDLSRGVDFRERPADQHEADEHFRANIDALSPEDAMALLSAALGLSRAGWNAFERFRHWKEKIADFMAAEAGREGGATATQAVEAIRETRGLGDVRSVHRRLSSVRRALPEWAKRRG